MKIDITKGYVISKTYHFNLHIELIPKEHWKKSYGYQNYIPTLYFQHGKIGVGTIHSSSKFIHEIPENIQDKLREYLSDPLVEIEIIKQIYKNYESNFEIVQCK